MVLGFYILSTIVENIINSRLSDTIALFIFCKPHPEITLQLFLLHVFASGHTNK